VLVVDDEQIIANTLVQILNLSGFDANAAYSGDKAIEVARLIQPEILISDVIMSGMTGIDASIQISRIVPGCRVILFSGQAATTDLLRKAAAQGFEFEIVAKPVHPRVLLNTLRNQEPA
jgi:DNA-binding NtrC family response regulator